MVTTNHVINYKDVSKSLTNILDVELSSGRKVLWLISGGSSLPIAAEVYMHMLSYSRENIFITFVDDKFGDKITNERAFCQLLGKAGRDCKISIVDANLTFQENVSNFNNLIVDKLQWADFCIGQFGLGEKFHTGGIWPFSRATSTRSVVCGYEREGVKHITVTPTLIKQLDVAFINSLGANKRELVEHFLSSEASIRAEPTQSLKRAKQCVLYSDVLPN